MATGELEKRQLQMTPDKPAVKLIQQVKTQWNSIYNMFECPLQLRWRVPAVLSDKTFTKQTDAKTLATPASNDVAVQHQ